jgi:hypothetical protein
MLVCLAHRLTADKREIKDFPKLPSATSFICRTIGRHAAPQLVPKVGLSYNVEVEETTMEIGIDCWCGIIAAAYWGEIAFKINKRRNFK